MSLPARPAETLNSYPGQPQTDRTGHPLQGGVRDVRKCPVGQNAATLTDFIKVFFVRPDKSTQKPDKWSCPGMSGGWGEKRVFVGAGECPIPRLAPAQSQNRIKKSLCLTPIATSVSGVAMPTKKPRTMAGLIRLDCVQGYRRKWSSGSISSWSASRLISKRGGGRLSYSAMSTMSA